MRMLLILPALFSVMALPMLPQKTAADPRAEIEAFNQSFADATRHMDNAATMALWADDGISLLPSTPPIVGKPAITAFIDRVTAQFPGAKMEKFELSCFAIEVSGDLASEWCTEHQVILMAEGKPPFDGRGKMLLVLHKNSDGRWLLEREMWNQGVEDSGTKAASAT